MATQLAKRRIRTAKPSPRVRRLVLSQADYLMFEAIDRHGPLPSSYLYEFTKHLRRDRTHLQNRLTEFYNGDADGVYLTRPPQQFASYQARYQHLVYDLAPRARRFLAERGTLTSYSAARCDPFVHRLMGACVGASIELSAPEQGVRYISFQEILNHPKCGGARNSRNPLALPISGGTATLIPDALFGLEYPGEGFRFFAVEIDRATEPVERRDIRQSSSGRKMEGYVAALREQSYRAWWGVPNLHILMVTTNKMHARAMSEYIAKFLEPSWQNRMLVAAKNAFDIKLTIMELDNIDITSL